MKLFRLKFTSPAIEREYNKIKETNMKSFFKLLIFVLVVFTILGVAQAIKIGSLNDFIRSAVILLVCLVLLKYGYKIERCIDYILGSLCLALYLSGVVSNGHTASALAASNAQTALSFYYLGYLSGVFERLVILELTRLELKIIFGTVSLITRLVIWPPSNAFSYCYMIFYWALCLFVDIRREKNDRVIFRSFYNFREEILKFKNLMVSGIPTGVLILTKDAKQKLFYNDHFQETFKIAPNEEHWSPQIWLEATRVEKESVSVASIRNEIHENLTLEEFLEILTEKDFQKDQVPNISFTTRIMTNEEDECDGSRVFETKVLPMAWDGREAIIVLMNDVTQQYMNLTLKIADANKDKMLAMVSHEFRNPLNGILGMISIMEKKIKNKEFLKYFAVCKNSGKLLLNLVNSILDLGMIRNNKLKLSITKGSLEELLQDIYLLFEFQFKQKHLYLSVDTADDAPKNIVSDLNRLRQVLINLIANALKFTFEGGVHVSVSKDEDNAENLLFKVTDTGIGIRDEEKKKLFKMYGRLDQNDGKINAEGVGLGLTISDHLVRLLSCNYEEESIRVESQFGKGTTLSFSIKANLEICDGTSDKDRISRLEEADSSINEEGDNEQYRKISMRMIQSNRGLNTSDISNLEANNSNRKRPRSTYYDQEKDHARKSSLDPFNTVSSYTDNGEDVPLKKKEYKGHVLLVEDQPFNIMVAKNLIESLGYRVQTALNGKLAVDLLKKMAVSSTPFDLIFMDCQMPVMDGYEATTIIRESEDSEMISKIPIIALSATDTEDDKRRCKKVGMNAHLVKPVTENRLKTILDKYCKKKL